MSFRLEKGQALGIVGESGSGKSTIAKLITYLLELTKGHIMLYGNDITNVRGKTLREVYREIQMVFQMPAEFFDSRCTLETASGRVCKTKE